MFDGIIDEDIVLEKLKLLLQAGANPNAYSNEHGNVLHFIAKTFNTYITRAIDIIQAYSHHTFDYTQKNPKGDTLLHLAIKIKNLAAIKKLMALHSQGIDIGLDIPDAENRTPLMNAVALGNVSSTASLLCVGALQKGIGKMLTPPQSLVESILQSVDIEPSRHSQATQNYLCEAHGGFPIRAMNDNGVGRLIIISKENEALINEAKTYVHQQGNTLTLAYMGVQTTCLNHSLTSTYLEACESGRKYVRKEIVNHSFRLACAVGDIEKVKQFLQDENVNINGRDPFYQRSALHYAVMRAALLPKYIRQSGVNWNAAVAMSKHVAIVEMLLGHGAQTDAKNSEGNTVLDIVKREAEGEQKTTSTPCDREVAKALLKVLQPKMAASKVFQ